MRSTWTHTQPQKEKESLPLTAVSFHVWLTSRWCISHHAVKKTGGQYFPQTLSPGGQWLLPLGSWLTCQQKGYTGHRQEPQVEAPSLVSYPPGPPSSVLSQPLCTSQRPFFELTLWTKFWERERVQTEKKGPDLWDVRRETHQRKDPDRKKMHVS